jgi:hypothetical protein
VFRDKIVLFGTGESAHAEAPEPPLVGRPAIVKEASPDIAAVDCLADEVVELPIAAPARAPSSKHAWRRVMALSVAVSVLTGW